MKEKTRGLALIAMLLALCVSVQAQSAEKMPRVGVLVSATPSAAAKRVEAFQQGLRERGFVVGKNIVLEYRYAEGRPETLPGRIDELICLKVDIIVTDTSNAIQAAKKTFQGGRGKRIGAAAPFLRSERGR
jgi:putative ABC transport system substrate-binding protein